MSKKPVKYGLMFWMLCDADSRYVLSLDLYTGKKNNVIQKNLATDVVLHLADRLPNNVKQGRIITFYQYFTDMKLSEAVLNRKMTFIGVVEHRRCFLPNKLKPCRKQLFSSWFYFSDPYKLLSYHAKENKRPIILLPSLHKVPETCGGEKKLACAVHDYNQTKFDVVATDPCIGSCTVRRINRRWPMTVFFII
ncbi:unnamed protein product [Rotaria socialis]|uniref:PiggyBac transposable element-derived protein domain-containing protein n=1 Tax=Rotaria socialis TaxID=392032 RepID=A0A821UX81_9BILA|nr:unnamed protein product [Rotaria socialis]CAF4130069.1 unnamed protein product [Rotaria socialis]CAF4561453.1 unnamed protein product [Rotaria socialis]CAF4680058.1 unnamed protein product [Rotaria socialis]CAF4897039.1 unnamed protein product [Rotaria socialis]